MRCSPKTIRINFSLNIINPRIHLRVLKLKLRLNLLKLKLDPRLNATYFVGKPPNERNNPKDGAPKLVNMPQGCHVQLDHLIFWHAHYLTRFSLGLAFFADGLAFRVADASIAPAFFIGIPSLAAIAF